MGQGRSRRRVTACPSSVMGWSKSNAGARSVGAGTGDPRHVRRTTLEGLITRSTTAGLIVYTHLFLIYFLTFL